MDKDEEYKVGPGRPPREHQFKKNKSGNPGGKKKGTLNFKTVLLRELAAEVAVKNGGKILMLEAIVRRLTHDAAGGKHRAVDTVVKSLLRFEGLSPEAPEELSEDDEAILRRMGYRDEGHTPSDSEDAEPNDE